MRVLFNVVSVLSLLLLITMATFWVRSYRMTEYYGIRSGLGGDDYVYRVAAVPRGQVCGYDLRATPQRCPECGTEVIRPAPPA